MPFVITATDAGNVVDRRKALRPKHIAYLEANLAIIVAAGALLDDEGTEAIGSLYIIDVDTREKAECFLRNDPYMASDIFGSYTIARWRKGYFNHSSLQKIV